MGNLPIRQDGGQAMVRKPEWDPMAWARELLRWDPFREMTPSFAVELPSFTPAFEVKETKEGYTFRADVPGVLEKDIEITRTGNRLTVSGKRESEKEEKGETYYTCERSYGSFTRAFTLPDGADWEHITSRLDGGVLTIVVPKKPEVMPKKIAVKVETRTKA